MFPQALRPMKEVMRTSSRPVINPSLMCANQADLGGDLARLEAGGADMFHFDIMDGDFVPNFTFGPQILEGLRPLTRLPFDTHLMVRRPERYIERFRLAGSDVITVHAEATDHLQRTLVEIRKSGAKAGVALNPATPLSAIRHVLDVTDLVLLMTVNPGFAGQPFVPAVVPKIRTLARLIRRHGLPIQIEVDGNLGPKTIPLCLEAGAEILVCGTSSLFLPGQDLTAATQQLRNTLA